MIRTTVTFETTEAMQALLRFIGVDTPPPATPKSKVVTIRQLILEKHVRRFESVFRAAFLDELNQRLRKGKAE